MSVQVIKGDITRLKVDAIVNAANSSLMGGGGVDGAIHRAGGPIILEQCKQIVAQQGRCDTGEAVITAAGNLPSKYVIHTVGPVWSGAAEDRTLLANCYRKSLQLAADHKCKTIAFPNISTGIYGYPKAEAAAVSVSAVNKFLSTTRLIETVIFCCFDDENYQLVEEQLC